MSAEDQGHPNAAICRHCSTCKVVVLGVKYCNVCDYESLQQARMHERHTR